MARGNLHKYKMTMFLQLLHQKTTVSSTAALTVSMELHPDSRKNAVKANPASSRRHVKTILIATIGKGDVQKLEKPIEKVHVDRDGLLVFSGLCARGARLVTSH